MSEDKIKTQYLADGGKEENWGMDFWGMVIASLKATGKWDEYVRSTIEQIRSR
jgi:hypothetical protein